MAPNLPSRIVAGTLVGMFALTAIPNGADRDIHAPHVPETLYIIPFNTSESFVTISASGASSRADFSQGPNDVTVASDRAVSIHFIPSVAASSANPHSVYRVTFRQPSLLASDLLHPRDGPRPTE